MQNSGNKSFDIVRDHRAAHEGEPDSKWDELKNVQEGVTDKRKWLNDELQNIADMLRSGRISEEKAAEYRKEVLATESGQNQAPDAGGAPAAQNEDTTQSQSEETQNSEPRLASDEEKERYASLSQFYGPGDEDTWEDWEEYDTVKLTQQKSANVGNVKEYKDQDERMYENWQSIAMPEDMMQPAGQDQGDNTNKEPAQNADPNDTSDIKITYYDTGSSPITQTAQIVPSGRPISVKPVGQSQNQGNAAPTGPIQQNANPDQKTAPGQGSNQTDPKAEPEVKPEPEPEADQETEPEAESNPEATSSKEQLMEEAVQAVKELETFKNANPEKSLPKSFSEKLGRAFHKIFMAIKHKQEIMDESLQSIEKLKKKRYDLELKIKEEKARLQAAEAQQKETENGFTLEDISNAYAGWVNGDDRVDDDIKKIFLSEKPLNEQTKAYLDQWYENANEDQREFLRGLSGDSGYFSIFKKERSPAARTVMEWIEQRPDLFSQ